MSESRNPQFEGKVIGDMERKGHNPRPPPSVRPSPPPPPPPLQQSPPDPGKN